jgi:hypothetical protein
MSDGVITTSGSKPRTNGKLHSKQTEDSNPRLCSLECVTLWQHSMDSIFSNMIEEQKVIVYMDNILIFAENQEELQEQTKQVLQRL